MVYEAEDKNLERHVALKFLPDTLAGSQEALSASAARPSRPPR